MVLDVLGLQLHGVVGEDEDKGKDPADCSVTKTLDGSIFPKRPALDQLDLIE